MGYFLIFLLFIVLLFFIAVLVGTFMPSKMASDYFKMFKSKNEPETKA